jgi:hypothetical protein
MTGRKCGTQIADKAIICYKCGTATASAPAGASASQAGTSRRSGKGAGTKVPAYVWVIIAGLLVAVAIWWLRFR